MNQFVDQCRREWKRLGVPEAAANEMAADLVADLAEAQADGVSPEEVLGNGFFDPAAFAASWATARGLALAPRAAGFPRRSPSGRWHLPRAPLCVWSWRPRDSSSLPGPGSGRRPSPWRPSGARSDSVLPPPIAGPHQVFVMRTGGPAGPVGWILLLAGIVGVGIVLWCWRRWSTPQSGSSSNPNVEMPSYL